MHFFLEVVEGAEARGRSVWLEPGDVCRIGSDPRNELVLAGADIPARAATVLFEGPGARWIEQGGEWKAGERITMGSFQIQACPYPAASETASPLGKMIGWMRKRPGHLFAVYDAARSPRVLDLLQASRLPHLSLFDGDARETMADSAPYLVEIPGGDPALELIVRASWGKGWAIFLASSAGFKEVRGHLRRQLMAQLPDGQIAYFRFFDPAILQPFLRGSTPKEWADFGGPVSEFVVEQRNRPQAVVRLRVATATIEACGLEEVSNVED